jgi:hypothetical protein
MPGNLPTTNLLSLFRDRLTLVAVLLCLLMACVLLLLAAALSFGWDYAPIIVLIWFGLALPLVVGMVIGKAVGRGWHEQV